ncbi:MAG TPA: hypothetical protein DGH68_09070 [Bacteroidetes bacterium]|nr:hypothetical protein [Bacteroidota bacterium]
MKENTFEVGYVITFRCLDGMIRNANGKIKEENPPSRGNDSRAIRSNRTWVMRQEESNHLCVHSLPFLGPSTSTLAADEDSLLPHLGSLDYSICAKF